MKILKFVTGINVPMIEPDLNQSTKRKEDDDMSKRNEKKSQFEWKESKLPPLKYNNYTPLNTTHINILIEFCNKDIIN